MKVLRVFFLGFVGIIILRLFNLQVVNAEFYEQLAGSQHDFYRELFADRGDVIVKDWKESNEFLAATNEPRAFIYADPRKIENPEEAAFAIGEILGYEKPDAEDLKELAGDDGDQGDQVDEGDRPSSILEGVEEAVESEQETEDEQLNTSTLEPEASADEPEKPNEILLLIERFSKEDDPYEPVARNIDEDTLDKILELEIDGIDFVLEDGRSYPEANLDGHVLGFVNTNDEGEKVGNYGIEGYFNKFLSGVNGFLDVQKDVSGRWIGVGARKIEPAKDGGDVVLTLDRTIQFTACQALADGVERYQADGGSLVIIEPKTGRVMAMCSSPDFDPNDYADVEDVSVYNNRAIFEAYEPGSVFKPLVMAGALDQGVVTPTTLFNDTGEQKIDVYTIRNSDLKAHGLVSMTEILQESLNTGMIHVMRLLTGPTMLSYIENFGFGSYTGIQLSTESSGTIDALYKDSEIYYATASYGQGLTVTPIQLAQAYAALANGGKLMKPYIVEETRAADGTTEKTRPEFIRQVVSSKTATTVGAMMVSVIEEGHAKLAAVPGYYLAGKTGTAQVAGSGGKYLDGVTKATFAGFGPVEDPVFSMVVMLDHPRTSPWAADTAAPIFSEVGDFLLHYLEVAPRRETEE